MKKIWALLLALSLLLASTAVSADDYDPVKEFGSNVLNVYNWGEYMDMDIIRAFENEYKVRVNYSTYPSNEDMYTKLLTGAAFDVLFPSDYMVQRLIRENLLQPLDRSVVTNLDNLSDSVKNLYYDPDNTYSVPYLWQSVGILYDTTKIDPAEIEEQGWLAFMNPDYAGHAYVYDSEREGFLMALKTLGLSVNTTKQEDLDAAFEWLREMDKTIRPSYVTDEVIDGMLESQKWLAEVYSGDAAMIMLENEDMSYCTPKQGTNIAVDTMVIPANAENPKLANVFINYILEYENNRKLSEMLGYASPNQLVLDALSGPGGLYEGNIAYIPRSGYELDEYYYDIPNEMRASYSTMWVKVKLHE
jgi:spermidine/putrescine transport system substrate-binding protein/spermidine/putrescine transport system permease protein